MLDFRSIARKVLYVNRDPNLLPVKVRKFIVVISVPIVWIALFSHAHAWNKLAACGLMLGVFGSGTLYWETVADERELTSVSNELARMSDKNLSFFETGLVITFCQIGVIQFFVYSQVWFTHLRIGQNGLQTSAGLGLIFAVFMSPATGTYLLTKLLRYRNYTWMQGFQAAPALLKKEMTKRLLRTVGFASLFLSGVMQVPATLV